MSDTTKIELTRSELAILLGMIDWRCLDIESQGLKEQCGSSFTIREKITKAIELIEEERVRT